MNLQRQASNIDLVREWEEHIQWAFELVFEEEVRILSMFLEIHDPHLLPRVRQVIQSFGRPTIEIRTLLRKTVGEKHWMGFINYSRVHLKRNNRARIPAAFNGEPAPIPPYPRLSTALNDDVTTLIFDFLDPKSIYEASKVSRGFRDALIPRQRNVTLAGFRSVYSFRQFNFVGMEFFTSSESPLATLDFLFVLANDLVSYPNLTRLDLRGCTGQKELQFIGDFGPRLESIRCDNYEPPSKRRKRLV